MEQNKIRTYLLYAFGEITLVMIGILLALQVNNWNEHRKLKIEEQTILSALKTEFLQNKLAIEEAIERKQTDLNIINNMLYRFGQDNSDLSHAASDSMMLTMMSFVSADLGNPALNNVIDSGGIHLIADDSLKMLLTNWEIEVYDLLIENEQNLTVINTDFILPEITKHYDLALDIWPFSFSDIPNLDISYKEIYQDVEFRNSSLRKHVIMKLSLIENRELLQILDQIVTKINQNLN